MCGTTIGEDASMTFSDWYCETVELFVYAAVATICLW